MDSDEDEPVYVPTPFVLSGAPPNRRLDIPQTVTWEKCLCHCVEDEQGQLTEFAERSWQSFLKAAAMGRMVQDIITDHFAPRGENCCNSNFLRSTTLKFSGNDQRTL